VTPASSPPRFTRARAIVHRSFTMIGDASLAENTKRDHESAAGDSRRNPVLASDDETQSRWARKFFYCQKLRLRVHASRFSRLSINRCRVDRTSIDKCVNDKSDCGTVASCTTNDHAYVVFACHWRRCINALMHCRSTRFTRSRAGASTLP
jgi:hypothetical protein